ncbi:MAG: hypothetical protein HY964_02300 [Ignavibacteriales bacterium]|nr:hypothetical protein [Ignavibacteriales bacterium]
MTKLLEKAITEVSKLPEDEQDSVASIILEELVSEERWAKAFSGSRNKLAQLAKEALSDYRSGKTKPLNL